MRWLAALLLAPGITQWVSAHDAPKRLWGGINKANVYASTDTERLGLDAATTILSRQNEVPATEASTRHLICEEKNHTDGVDSSNRDFNGNSGSAALAAEKIYMIKRDGSRDLLDEKEVCNDE